MTLDSAIQNATLFYGFVGKKVNQIKKDKTKTVTRITAYRKDKDDWDVAIFFETQLKSDTIKPDCFLSEFIKDYEEIQ